MYRISITVDVYEDGVKLGTVKEDKYISEEFIESLLEFEDKEKK